MIFLTVKEASERLKVSSDVLYPMLVRGEIPAGKIRGQWRLIEEDLVDWLRKQYASEHSSTENTRSCPTEEKEQTIGGSLSREYANLLGLPTRKQPLRLRQG